MKWYIYMCIYIYIYMADVYPTPSIVTLHVNGLNNSINRDCQTGLKNKIQLYADILSIGNTPDSMI